MTRRAPPRALIPAFAGTVGMLVLAIAILMISLTSKPAQGAEHGHPPQDEPLHEKFYRTWMMPDRPNMSCCNKQDCYPTEISFVGGKLHARRREDGMWLPVPAAKIERHRDNPDGRNHLCAPPPGTDHGDVVFCFSLGGGT